MRNKGNRVLVVEDAEDSQRLLNLLLSRKEFDVISASNGVEALEILRDLLYLPSAIVMDVHMPVMDGFEFRRQQLADSRLANLPVVVITADEDKELQTKLSDPEKILVKPFTVSTLVAALEEVILVKNAAKEAATL